jgi:hypothetical protein
VNRVDDPSKMFGHVEGPGADILNPVQVSAAGVFPETVGSHR